MNGGMACEQLAATPEHADAGGPEHLVAGEGGEVDTEVGHVERQVRRRLARVEDGQRADGPGGGGQLADRVDGAEHVGDVGERERPWCAR